MSASTRTRVASAAIALVLMLCAAVAAWAMTPRILLVDRLGRLDIQAVVPTEFGDWKLVPDGGRYIVNPEQQELLDKVYSQLLNRTYVNAAGQQIMLAIAYGENQRGAYSLHYPEICYPAQGFAIESNRLESLATPAGEIPVRRLVTSLDGQRRHEPVTYWTMIGEQPSMRGLRKRTVELEYGLHGVIPDGLLFRVSSIDPDDARAFAAQDQFVRELIAVLPKGALPRLTGLRRDGPTAR